MWHPWDVAMRPESWRIRLALVLKTSRAAQRSEICVPVTSYGRIIRLSNYVTSVRRRNETRVLENTSCVGTEDVSGGPAFWNLCSSDVVWTYNKIKSLCDIRETFLRRKVETIVLENTSCVGTEDVSGGPAFWNLCSSDVTIGRIIRLSPYVTSARRS